MKPLADANEADPPVWEEFRAVVNKHQQNVEFGYLNRNEFYQKTRDAYATIATSEDALYACVIIKKGINI